MRECYWIGRRSGGPVDRIDVRRPVPGTSAPVSGTAGTALVR